MTSYDEILYPGRLYPDTHPDRLGTTATLFGMRPAPVERCRVLEIACGDAANLIPMAYGLPGSEFVGFDLAGGPIETGKEMARRLGLANLSLSQCDLAEFPAAAGQFDYIVAHGLYSWVPAPVRDALLALIAARLTPSGVAFVSYNVYPGCYARRMLWEMLRFHTDHLEDPRARIDEARALARMLRGGRRTEDEQATLLALEAGRLLERDPAFLFHDDLSEVNEPVYFHQFIEHAADHDLQFLGEAELKIMGYGGLTQEAARVLESMEPLAREQYLDFLRCRRFRQTLLCRSAVQLDRQLGPEKLEHMLLGMRARVKVHEESGVAPEAEALRDQENGANAHSDETLLQAILDVLTDVAPELLTPADLMRRVGEGAAADILKQRGPMVLRQLTLGAVRVGAIELHLHAARLTVEPSERPVANPIARLQLETDNIVSSLCHDSVRLDDEIAASILKLLDGTRDRAALLAALSDRLKGDGPTARAETLEAHLRSFGKLGLLAA